MTTCAQVRELAPELAVGALDGGERAAVLTHLADCADCRTYVGRLGEVADALLLAVPEADPPAGFELRVLRAARRTGRRRRVLAAVAAAIVVPIGVGVGVRAVREPAPRSALHAGVMLDEHRRAVGHAAVYGGAAAFVSVRVDDWGTSGDYEVVVVLHDRRQVRVAGIRLVEGRGAAGGPLPVPVADVRSVWVTDRARESWCAFRIAARD